MPCCVRKRRDEALRRTLGDAARHLPAAQAFFSDREIRDLRGGSEALLEVESAERTFFRNPQDPLGP